MQPGKFRMRPGRPCASPAVLPHVDWRSAFAARDWRVIEPPRVAPGRCARGNGWALRSGCGATGQLSLRVPASCVPGFADGMFTGDPMTSYSVARSAQRAIVVATWPGPWSDHSANVTTLSDFGLAAHLTSFLTRLSEDAWDAAAFLDASPVLEAAVSELVQQLRTPAGRIEAVHLRADGLRHADQWSFADATELLAEDAPSVFSAAPDPAAHGRRRDCRRRLRAR
jgi:hypothetical protein